MSSTGRPGDAGAGAGFSLASRADATDDIKSPKEQYSVASRALALSSYFLSGVLCINFSQVLGTPLYLVNSDWYNAWIAFTKQSFGLLTMTLTQAFAPTTVIVSGDASVRGQILQKTDGTILLDFPQRIILIANHQIYTDWLYLWWAAYCSGMHGRLYIILKESLKRIPVIGWGMQLSQFIFLKRNWEKDRPHMAEAMRRLNKVTEPMWLLLFPEGTNLAPSTREKSARWAQKTGVKDLRHCLLPRSTGLHFCLEELKQTVDYLYDCTIAYEGVPRGQYAQDLFTLKAGYLEGRPPKSVSMYWRRFAIKDIPSHNQDVFDLWLKARWREKDLLIENYLIHGHFPSDTGVSKTPTNKVMRGCGLMKVPIKPNHWYEFLQIFAPMGILAMVLYTFYGALPQKFLKAANRQALNTNVKDMQAIREAVPKSSFNLDLDSFFDKDKQAQTFGNAGMALSRWVQSPEAKMMMSRVDEVQKWLADPQKAVLDTLTGQPEEQTFLKLMEEEEARRRRAKLGPHQGTFWKDVETAESKKKISSTGGKSSAKVVAAGKPTGTIPNGSQKALGKPLPAISKQKGTFWDDLRSQETSRFGSVMTISSSNSTSASGWAAAPTKLAPSTKASPKPTAPTTSNKAQPKANKAAALNKPGSVLPKPRVGSAATPTGTSKPVSTPAKTQQPLKKVSAQPVTQKKSPPKLGKPLASTKPKSTTSKPSSGSKISSPGTVKKPTTLNGKIIPGNSKIGPDKLQTLPPKVKPGPKTVQSAG